MGCGFWSCDLFSCCETLGAGDGDLDSGEDRSIGLISENIKENYEKSKFVCLIVDDLDKCNL